MCAYQEWGGAVDDYRVIADELAAAIASGRLRPGDRLPPLRRYARQRGIASSTAGRVYRELTRRGLTVGEVGRGTFVRTAAPATEPALAEPGGARIDLELNFPVLPEQPARLAASLQHLVHAEALGPSLRAVGVAGTAPARHAAATHLARGGWTPDPRRLLFAGNGRQAIAAAVAALVPAGERLGVEALTYPVVKGIAARLGVTLVPLAMDEHGLVPEAIDAAPPLRAVYLQPALHNPLGITMPGPRREQLAETLRRHDLFAIEDAIYGFLRSDLPPLAALAPERTVLVDSLSKRLAPGLTLGFVVPPAGRTQDFATALRSGTWTAGGFALDAATRWMTDGTAAAVEEGKRRDAAARQRLAAERLAPHAVQADPRAYHLWWPLPDPWRADTFVAAAARRGIAVTPSGAFAVGTGHVPNAVRLALGSPPLDALADALGALAELAHGTPEDAGAE
ncbi:PLP-dependent aminotransferase family protein [Streptomyces sp. NPDC053427]|uniref:PLP-dependent aminotransferase family protein n=1 Tax=Streptomyces sp. NPDC053427 TaxID=3365701 RepID=UPI0037D7FA25